MKDHIVSSSGHASNDPVTRGGLFWLRQSNAERLQWIGAVAVAVTVAAAIYMAWTPLYQASRVGSSPLLAALEAIAVLGLAVGSAGFIIDQQQRGEAVPLVALAGFAGSLAAILYASDYRATSAAGLVLSAVPDFAAFAAVGLLLLPRRPDVPEVPRVPEAPEDDPLEQPLADPTVLYRFYRADGALLYVGITRHLDRRFQQHARSKPWWHEVARTQADTYASRRAAARAEHAAITGENPVHNKARYSLESHLRAAAGQ